MDQDKREKGPFNVPVYGGQLAWHISVFHKNSHWGRHDPAVDWLTGVVKSLLADYNLRHGKFMPFHIGLEGLSLFCGIVFFLCNLFAIYHKGVHRVCLSCGR